ncbi:hypothetical protein V8F20_011727 [Naviculisporaceae sp. PSN 640]
MGRDITLLFCTFFLQGIHMKNALTPWNGYNSSKDEPRGVIFVPRRGQRPGVVCRSPKTTIINLDTFIFNKTPAHIKMADPERGLSAKQLRKKECVICREEFERYRLFKSTCSHRFCPACLEKFVRENLCEAKFPAKCCDDPIPETANDFLPAELVATLELKEVEYGIPIEQRVFCRGCASVLLPWNIDNSTMTGTCVRCADKTCTRCFGFKHEGRRCEFGGTLEGLKNMSSENKWAKCYRCGQVVEKLGDDCDHITCACGAEFCYKCSAEWKTCACYHAEFDFHGATNANFRAANPHITSEMEIDQARETEEPADETTAQPESSEMETDPLPEESENADVDMEQPQSHGDQPAAVGLERNPRVRHRMYYPIDGDLASNIVQTTAAVLEKSAAKSAPQFPPRDWTCLHNDYYAIHHSGPFNCADCAVIQTEYILECKKCKIHLCVRCSDLYKPRDWWLDGPPRGRSKPARSQEAFTGKK